MRTVHVIELLQEKQANQTIQQLADKIGCTPALIYSVYSGAAQPGPKILKFLGLTRTKKVEVEYSRKRA
jgi:hypothetical protein